MSEMSRGDKIMAEMAFEINELNDDELAGLAMGYLHVHNSISNMVTTLVDACSTGKYPGLNPLTVKVIETLSQSVTDYYNLVTATAVMRGIVFGGRHRSEEEE